MVQALPLLTSGAADKYGLSAEHLALACASHNGAAIHTDRVRTWLEQLGLDDDALRCGPQVPGDEDALHYGVTKNGQLVCVASIYIDGHSARLRKFATLEEFQKQGIGSLLIKHILDTLREKKITHFWCDAREASIDFYKRFDMEVEGERFFKSDVPYFKMSKTLP